MGALGPPRRSAGRACALAWCWRHGHAQGERSGAHSQKRAEGEVLVLARRLRAQGLRGWQENKITPHYHANHATFHRSRDVYTRSRDVYTRSRDAYAGPIRDRCPDPLLGASSRFLPGPPLARDRPIENPRRPLHAAKWRDARGRVIIGVVPHDGQLSLDVVHIHHGRSCIAYESGPARAIGHACMPRTARHEA